MHSAHGAAVDGGRRNLYSEHVLLPIARKISGCLGSLVKSSTNVFGAVSLIVAALETRNVEYHDPPAKTENY